MSSSVANHIVWAIKSNNTLVSVKLANGIVVHSISIATGLVLIGIWQAYVIFLVLYVSFKLIISMP